MVVHRVTQERFAKDLSGEGARLHKGRWNPAGVPIIYTSTSVALAAIECFVNTPPGIVDCSTFVRVDISLPDEALIESVTVEELPENWHIVPAPDYLGEIGRSWAEGLGSLLLSVPSAALAGHENNILINPKHIQMRDVTIIKVQPFTYDQRLKSIPEKNRLD